jgi:hypothetical protein
MSPIQDAIEEIKLHTPVHFICTTHLLQNMDAVLEEIELRTPSTYESFTTTRARACKVHREVINCWAFTYEGNDTKFWDVYSRKALFRTLGFPIPEEKFQQPHHQREWIATVMWLILGINTNCILSFFTPKFENTT